MAVMDHQGQEGKDDKEPKVSVHLSGLIRSRSDRFRETETNAAHSGANFTREKKH